MRKLLFIATAALVAAGCGGRNTVEDGLYRNDFFGFTMEVPDGMYVMPRGAMDSLSAAAGRDMPDRAAERSELLLFISAREPSAADSLFNHNITITSEKLSSEKTDEQYMAHVLEMMVTQGSIRMPDEMTVMHDSLGGRKFMKTSIMRGSLSQDIYTLVHDGYALIIVGSYDGSEQREAVARILATITFNI